MVGQKTILKLICLIKHPLHCLLIIHTSKYIIICLLLELSHFFFARDLPGLDSVDQGVKLHVEEGGVGFVEDYVVFFGLLLLLQLFQPFIQSIRNSIILPYRFAYCHQDILCLSEVFIITWNLKGDQWS